MDQQQIDPRQLEPLEALVDRALEVAGRQAVEPDLCGDEDVLARHAGGAEAFADFALIAVVLRGIEMPVAEMQRRLDQLDAQIVLQRHGAEPDHRDFGAMTFNDMTFDHVHPLLLKVRLGDQRSAIAGMNASAMRTTPSRSAASGNSPWRAPQRRRRGP